MAFFSKMYFTENMLNLTCQKSFFVNTQSNNKSNTFYVTKQQTSSGAILHIFCVLQLPCQGVVTRSGWQGSTSTARLATTRSDGQKQVQNTYSQMKFYFLKTYVDFNFSVNANFNCILQIS